MSLLPCWAQPKAFTNLGNNIHDDISRENLVVVHSEGKEAQKLEALSIPGREFRGSLGTVDRILGGFKLTGWSVRYNLRFQILAPIQFFRENVKF